MTTSTNFGCKSKVHIQNFVHNMYNEQVDNLMFCLKHDVLLQSTQVDSRQKK